MILIAACGSIRSNPYPIGKQAHVPPADSSLASPSAPAESRTPDQGIPADRLDAGECGLICHIDGNHEDIERLKTMGVCLGRRLHMVKAGDPMIVSVMGTRLGIAARLSRHVFLRLDDGRPCHERHLDA